jgi:NhaC family Na+:H+ antiporter
MSDAKGAGPANPSSLGVSLAPILLLIGLLALSYILFGDSASLGPNQVALLLGALVAGGLAYARGLPWAGIRQAAIEGVGTGIGAIGILLAVGALIGTWALGGTIVAMVYYANIVTSDQYIAVVLPGRLFPPVFVRRGLAPVLLSRVLGDSAR